MDQAQPTILNYSRGDLHDKGYLEDYVNGELRFYISQYYIPGRHARVVALLFIVICISIALVIRRSILLIVFLPAVYFVLMIRDILKKFDPFEGQLQYRPLIVSVSDNALSINQQHGHIRQGIEIPVHEIEDLWIQRHRPDPVREFMDFSHWRLTIVLKDNRLIGMTIKCNSTVDLYELEIRLRNAIGVGLNPTLGPGRPIPPDAQRMEIVNKPGKIYLKNNNNPWWFFWNKVFP